MVVGAVALGRWRVLLGAAIACVLAVPAHGSRRHNILRTPKEAWADTDVAWR